MAHCLRMVAISPLGLTGGSPPKQPVILFGVVVLWLEERFLHSHFFVQYHL